VSNEAIRFYGDKFFPHLLPRYRILAVLEILEAIAVKEKEQPK
jgi:hypothetical protein